MNLYTLRSGSLDYILFCGLTVAVNTLSPNERIEAREYAKLKETEHLLLDVREKVQFDLCNLEGSINIPFSTFQGAAAADKTDSPTQPNWLPESLPRDAPIYIVCRLGNDSQVVARRLKNAGLDSEGRWVGDIKGGLKSWKEQVDEHWPEY